jgi:hypothetical protein
MRAPSVISPAAALLGWQHAVWVDLVLEPVEERLACVGGHPPTVVTGMHRMSGKARAQAALLRRQPSWHWRRPPDVAVACRPVGVGRSAHDDAPHTALRPPSTPIQTLFITQASRLRSRPRLVTRAS